MLLAAKNQRRMAGVESRLMLECEDRARSNACRFIATPRAVSTHPEARSRQGKGEFERQFSRLRLIHALTHHSFLLQATAAGGALGPLLQ
jgi:hypothetical protein